MHSFSALLKALLLLGAAALSLPAQINVPDQPTMFWDAERVIVLDGVEGFRMEHPSGIPPTDLKAPEDSKFLYFLEGKAWATVLRKVEGKRLTTLYRSDDFKTWTLVGEHPNEDRMVAGMIPLDTGKFFMMANMLPFSRDKRASPFAIGKLKSSGMIEMEHLVHLDLKEDLLMQGQVPGSPDKTTFSVNPKYQTLFLLANIPSMQPIIPCQGGFAIVSKRAGYLWIFDGGKGDLKRVVKIFESVDEKKLGPPEVIEYCIMGAQPRSNGHILVATRSEEAVLTALKLDPPMRLTKAMIEDKENVGKTLKELGESQGHSLIRFPEILWWDVDPKTGKVSRETPPQNVPTKIWDAKMFQSFTFRYKPDGNLVIGEAN